MQIIGIYINEGDAKVIKTLSQGWYPFGDFADCHKLYLEKKSFSEIKSRILQNKEFYKTIYSLGNEKALDININSIVGKNGAGKSTLLDIYYRIVNNFTIKLNQIYSKGKDTFEPSWAAGFDAELYFECNNEIGFIRSFKNKKNNKKNEIQFFFGQNEYYLDSKNDEELISKLYESFFYSIGINYSLYSYSEKSEKWKNRIYNKNDGYYTPLVLLPYRNDDVIDINKENRLAEERIKNLSLLLAISDNELIDGYLPYKIIYKLKSPNNYKSEIKKRILGIFKENHPWKSKDSAIRTINNYIQILSSLWKSKLPECKNKNVYSNALYYLSYKTIKICFTYTSYNKILTKGNIFEYLDILSGIDSDIFSLILTDITDEKKEYLNELKQIIDKLCTDKDHITLKIRQAITFLRDNIFKAASAMDGYISVDEFVNYYKGKEYTYDDIVLSLLPSFYNTTVYYRRSKDKDGSIRLQDFSSGECQILYSLSYIVYHLKNIESIQSIKDRIKYQNISLIFDEAELYYHPEYQRQFLYNLISILNRCNLKSIKAINIIIVTHSPFMLSDIPISNVSCILKDDNKKSIYKKTNGNTFSANFYDLIQNQFFVEAPTGAIAEQLFSEIIRDYKEFKINPNQHIFSKYSMNKKFYEKLSGLIGDDYFRRSISSMIDKMRSN